MAAALPATVMPNMRIKAFTVRMASSVTARR
jgi:hypothetical protein